MSEIEEKEFRSTRFHGSWWKSALDVTPSADTITAESLDEKLQSVFVRGEGVIGNYVRLDALGKRGDPVVAELRVLLIKAKTMFRTGVPKEMNTRSVSFIEDPYTHITWVETSDLFDVLHEIRGQVSARRGITMPYPAATKTTEPTEEPVLADVSPDESRDSASQRAIDDAVARRRRG